MLDVGCGDGELLQLLESRGIDGRGIELSREGVNRCVAKGLAVVQGDADTDLVNYPDDAFDYVILSQTLQATRQPKVVLENLLRIGRRAVVSFPNFGFWKMRLQLLVEAPTHAQEPAVVVARIVVIRRRRRAARLVRGDQSDGLAAGGLVCREQSLLQLGGHQMVAPPGADQHLGNASTAIDSHGDGARGVTPLGVDATGGGCVTRGRPQFLVGTQHVQRDQFLTTHDHSARTSARQPRVGIVSTAAHRRRPVAMPPARAA